MSTSKHPPSGHTPPEVDLHDNLQDNPGIGQSKGTFATGEDPSLIQGDHTVEGDIGNDTTPNGAVRRDHDAEANSTKANKTKGF